MKAKKLRAVFQLHVRLREIDPAIWRRIQVSTSSNVGGATSGRTGTVALSLCGEYGSTCTAQVRQKPLPRRMLEDRRGGNQECFPVIPAEGR